jgi:hypothetical protein
MKRKITYEIQQDNSNNRRVIRTGADGTRRAVDHPSCRTAKAARELIRDLRQFDREHPES